MKKIIFAALLLLANIQNASASLAPLSITANGDNIISVYISTNNATQGTLIGTGTDWTQALTATAALTAGVTNYLHITVTNSGGPGGLLGAFVLASNNNFTFANGTKTLLTGDAGLTQNLTGYGNAMNASVIESGVNSSIWGNLSSTYGTYAPQWIWNYVSTGSGDFETVFFSAAINSGTAVPEPASIALMALGLLALGFMRKRQG